MTDIEKKRWLFSSGEIFKELRIGKGYSSYENFATDFLIDRKQYWRIESGSNLTQFTILRILKIHKLPVSSFYIMVENKFNNNSNNYPEGMPSAKTNRQ
ncbi:MAG: hypothetical protein ABI855_16400 [Bacteroidota bacterium]